VLGCPPRARCAWPSGAPWAGAARYGVGFSPKALYVEAFLVKGGLFVAFGAGGGARPSDRAGPP
jgi:hypothetical protein